MPNLHNSIFYRLALVISMFLMLVQLTLVLWISHQEMSLLSKQPLLPLVQSRWQWMPVTVPFSFIKAILNSNHVSLSNSQKLSRKCRSMSMAVPGAMLFTNVRFPFLQTTSPAEAFAL